MRMYDSFYIELIEGDDFVLKLSGDLNAWSAQRFWNQMKDMLDTIESEEKAVFIDFADLTYIHSSGIGALLQLLEYCRNNNIPIKFRNIQGAVERIFNLANVTDLFPL